MRSFFAAVFICLVAGAAAWGGYEEPPITLLSHRFAAECQPPYREAAVDPQDMAAQAAAARAVWSYAVRPKPHFPSTDTSLLAKARRYIGTNPTGWRNLWCGRFLAMIAPNLARKIDNPNWARDWATLRHVKPSIGTIVVLRRGHGGHVGIVSGFDKHGNPRVVSGNHNRRVAESIYPKSHVIAYVSPNG